MNQPILPPNESLRLEALRQYDLLDTLPEQALDDLTILAAHICDVPISVISLVDEHRQWFKSRIGTTTCETAREISFCGHAILQPDLFVVPDATADERFADNPLVTDDPHVRFYAGAPLVTATGQAIGTLCVIDHVPRQLNSGQCEALRILSRQIMSQFELRIKTRELVEGNERQQIVTEHARVGLVIVNRDRRYVYANKTYAEILDLTSPTITGQRVPDVLAGLYEEQIRPNLDRAFAGERVAYELHKATKQGDHYYSVRYEPTKLGNEVSLVVVVVIDITERKRAEIQTERQRAELQFILDAVPAAVFYKDREGRFLRVNRELAQLVGAPPEAFEGKTDAQMGSPEGERYQHDDLRVIATGIPIRHLEEPLQTSRGVRWLLTDKVPYVDESGRIIGVVGLGVDITERRQAEMAMRRLAAIVESSQDAMIGKDLNSIVTSWNPGAEKLFGYSADEMVGSSIMKLIPADRQNEEDQILGKIKKGENVEHFETLRQTKAGRLITVSVAASPIRDSSGKVVGVSKVGRDLTERKKLEAQFLRAQRMESIGTLAGGIAHDLNNVLAPILMSIEMLRDPSRGQEETKLLDTLQASAQRGADLVKQVLSFARGVEGQRITVNPLHLMRDLLKVMQETFPKSIDVQFKPARDVWTVAGDPTQIHQVFLNLCVNARDAMPNGGNLTITMENVVLDETYAAMNSDARPGPYVIVKVADTGIGIPPGIQDRVFEPFFTTKEIGKGTGLGLSTTLAIVKSHSGFIHLYSEVGKGTKFKIYLPANATKLAADELELEQTRLPRGNGELILVVDDEKAIRDVAQRTLERFGYCILVAANGAEALALYAQHRNEIAAVLTDMAMPIMDGPATIIALKAMNPAVKIIGSSGLAINGGVAKAVGAGVQHFIPKPYTAEAILKTLHEVLHGQAGS